MKSEILHQKENPTDSELLLPEAIRLKCDLLVSGIAVDTSISELAFPYKEPVQAIYGYYQGSRPTVRYPEEIFIYKNNEEDFCDTDKVAVKVRTNSRSPNKLIFHDGQPVIQTKSRTVLVELAEMPEFYTLKTSAGTELWRIVQKLGTDTLGVIATNFCSYFAEGDECAFCEILPSYLEAREYEAPNKPIWEIQEAMQMVIDSGEIERIAMTTGNYDNENIETLDYLQSIYQGVDTSPLKQTCVLYFPNLDEKQYQRLKDLGITAVMHNLEVWTPEQFASINPGKEKHLGRENLLRMLELARDVLGVGNVFSNFVYGVQSLKGIDSSTFDQQVENEILWNASEYLVEHGIVPMFTVYHTTGKNRIGPINISPEKLHEFGIKYGQIVHHSGVVPEARSGSHGSLGSSGNHLFNDYYYLARKLAQT